MGSAISIPKEWRDDGDFTAARNAYIDNAGRSYSRTVGSGVSASDLVAPSIATTSKYPIIIVIDVTGSMQEWPATIRGKLPFLDLSARQIYFGDDAEILFMAVGDGYTDTYPLQVRAFHQGAALKTEIDTLTYEGRGGGQGTETYELAALYAARNISMSDEAKPLIIFIGDEKPYASVDPNMAQRVAKVKTDTISTIDIFAELREKGFSVYFIQKPYDTSTATNYESFDLYSREVHEAWAELLGRDHIAILPDPNRVVDVILGIFAKVTGQVDYYQYEIKKRQTKPGQVEAAFRSLKTILAVPPGAPASDPRGHSGKSIMLLEDDDAKPVSRPF